MAVSPSIYVDRVFLAPGTLAPRGRQRLWPALTGWMRTRRQGCSGRPLSFPPGFIRSLCQGSPHQEHGHGLGEPDRHLGRQTMRGRSVWSGDRHRRELRICREQRPALFTFTIPKPRKTSTGGFSTRASNPTRAVASITAPWTPSWNSGRKTESTRTGGGDPRPHLAVASRGKHQFPDTVASATYSAPFTISSALITGACWREQYTEEKIKDPQCPGPCDKNGSGEG